MHPRQMISDNVRENRFEIREGDAVAFLVYAKYPGVIELVHTEVPESIGGKGLGQELVHHALEYARANRLRVAPTCPFARTYIKRHKEYASLVQS